MSADEAVAALRRAAALGPVFALDAGAAAPGRAPVGAAPGGGVAAGGAGPVDAGPPWQPVDRLAADAAALVDAFTARLPGTPRRVAASLATLSFAARLTAPTLAALVTAGVAVAPAAGRTWWRYVPGRGVELRLESPAGWRRPDGAPPLRRWLADIVDDRLAPLLAAVRRDTPVAAGLLWGNVASGAAGALRHLALTGAAPVAAVAAAGRELLAHGPLAGTGTLAAGDGQLWFSRRSCCLYYLLPGGGTCADCCLPAAPRRRARH
ncbi:MAG TPA: (2Fe-2S)-binding protein [Pilimelia sp.]|nr:(2Fe-2S)-binding protein [Pilimelia sp.]